MHPKTPVNMGEKCVRSIYEALQISPQWNQTLFIITADEGRGFADYFPSPTNAPAGNNVDYTEEASDGKLYYVHFDRLGVRVSTLLTSSCVGRLLCRIDLPLVRLSLRILPF